MLDLNASYKCPPLNMLKLEEDHYRHALTYLWLAAQKTPVWESPEDLERRRIEMMLIEKQNKEYNLLTYGLNIKV